MRHFVTLPNLITSTSLALGFVALLTAQSHLWLAALLVVGAGLLDSVDGFVARRNGSDHAFGANLDSLADIVSFGAVPAVAIFLSVPDLPVLGALVGIAFLVSGAWRLARFPLTKDKDRFCGIPIPPAGVLVAVLAAWSPAPAVSLLATLALAALMVSRFPFPTVSSCLSGATTMSRHLVDRRGARN